MTIISGSPEETIAAGERIAELLLNGNPEGTVIALRGTLGAGKTWLTKGIARGLGVREEVTSPTYTIISEYRGKVPLYHIDAYRLQGDDDFAALGGDEILQGNGVSVVEWSERIPASIPENAVVIELEILAEGQRRICMEGGR